MKIDFKILSGYFIKILFVNYCHGYFKFFMLVFSYSTRFPIRLKFLKVDNLFIKKITNGFKMFLFILND